MKYLAKGSLGAQHIHNCVQMFAFSIKKNQFTRMVHGKTYNLIQNFQHIQHVYVCVYRLHLMYYNLY